LISIVAARIARFLIVSIPPRRRGMRVATLFERWFGRPRTPLRAKHLSGYRISCDLSDTVQRSLFYRGTYEPLATRLITQALDEGDTFLDVGANVGHYTFLAVRCVGPHGAVHAIEASTETATALRRDVTRNGLESIVSVHAVAAGDKRTQLLLREDEGVRDAGTRSLWLPDDGVGDRLEAIEMVDVVPLDELLPGLHPSAIKIDAEGADLRALIGMREIIHSSRPRLIVAEADDTQLARFGDSVAAIVSFLSALGFRPVPIEDEWHARSVAFIADD
jgi:FkbM family methyltransferase